MMYGRKKLWLHISKGLYLLLLFGLFIAVMVQGLVRSPVMTGYILFRNVNALFMFFLQPIFFWYPPR